MTVFPIARYQFEFVAESSIRLPEYAGSTLRGGFGQALRKIACMTREKNCKSCPLYRTCPYPAIFETPAPETHQLQIFNEIPSAYIIEPPPWGERIYQAGERLSFAMVLVGHTLRQLPLITLAWQRAFAHGVGHGTARLQKIYYQSQEGVILVYDEQTQRIEDHKPSLNLKTADTTEMIIEFHSPLRIQRNGKPLRATQLTQRDLLMALARRVSLIMEFHTELMYQLDFKMLVAQSMEVEHQHQLQWRDWTRYSSRQKQTMQLGGVVGKWSLQNISPTWSQLLQIGHWLHIGKNATFGLGGYAIL